MSQADYTIDNQLGINFRLEVQASFRALLSMNSGATEPATTFANMWWWDTSADLVKMRNSANDDWITVADYDGGAFVWRVSAGGTGAETAADARANLGTDTGVSDKSGAYTAVAADRNKVLRFTAAATLSLTAAATLTSDWLCYVAADGGDVTIDPNGSETINGETTLTVTDGTSAIIFCTGTGFVAVVTAAASTPTSDGLFYKSDWESVAFTKTGAGTASIKAGTKIEVAGTIVEFSSATAITMPTLTAGTDYAIWVKDDGTIQADTSFTAAPGAGNWRKIGGFHYDGEPKIKARSFWDLKFRPAAPDPRGMTLNLDESCWVDCYPCNTDPDTNGTSKYGATIADDTSPPKIPTKFGGDGTTTYGSFTWYEANEVMASQGKQLLSQGESCVARYGSAEASSIGSDPVTTQYIAARESDCGMDMATGCVWEWGLGDGSSGSGSSWSASTEGRGSYYLEPNKPRFGGSWRNGSASGSRCALWSHAPSNSYDSSGARGRSDHVCHV